MSCLQKGSILSGFFVYNCSKYAKRKYAHQLASIRPSNLSKIRPTAPIFSGLFNFIPFHFQTLSNYF